MDSPGKRRRIIVLVINVLLGSISLLWVMRSDTKVLVYSLLTPLFWLCLVVGVASFVVKLYLYLLLMAAVNAFYSPVICMRTMKAIFWSKNEVLPCNLSPIFPNYF